MLMVSSAVHFLLKVPTKYARGTYRTLRWWAAKKLLVIAGKNGFLASLYFTFFSTKYYREHQAVLKGISAFRATDLSKKTSFGGFRRNVHRIEKGLSMTPPRPRFAEEYIGETCAQFASAKSIGSQIDAEELKWAGDVLVAYFDAVEDSPRIATARRRFEEAAYSPEKGERRFVPYSKRDVEPSQLEFNDLRKLFVERRSVRWFDDRPVPSELLEKAVGAASLAPTACNRQPYRFHILHGPRAVEIAGLAGGTAGWSAQIPCIFVVVGDLSNFIEVRDRHIIYIDGSLAAMQLMLALQTLGLSTVPINWPDVTEREERMQQALELNLYERPIMLIAVGYGADEGKIPFSQKKPAHLLMVEERSNGRSEKL